MLKDSRYFEELTVKKSEEVRTLLDSRDTRHKLEGMKRLIAMISLGRDASPYFPDVVKNVIAESLEVKKLVYMFLAHYAEAKSDIALLSINTFQKDLSDSNQLIRALALRVMTNIRVQIIVQLQLMAIKKCVRDGSPYVRKAAAHAVPKVYSLDPDQKDPLVEIVGLLMTDNSTMVIGSAVAAFIEVCPEETRLIHPNFRKFCRLCADTDEWGQILVINMLCRYARSNFTNPNEKPKAVELEKGAKQKKYRLKKKAAEKKGKKSKKDKKKSSKAKGRGGEMSLEAFYGEDGDESSETPAYPNVQDRDEWDETAPSGPSKMSLPPDAPHPGEDWETDSDASSDAEDLAVDDEVELSADHKLMLRSTEPLFRSRNAGVVLAVASLFYYTAPGKQVAKVGKSLIRLIHQSRETSYVVLSNIATMVQQRPDMFAGLVKEFYVKSTDPAFSALIKLDILTHLITQQNSTLILKEFQAYVKLHDATLVAATIQAIGRCANRVPELTQNCMRGLMDIIKSNRNETVVAESVVVMQNMLHKDPEGHIRIIRQLAGLLDTMKVPAARASIIWMIGEYRSLIPKIGPDALRVLAKGFADEAPAVKLQILNLGAKLHLSNPEQCSALFRYVCSVAKFDANYDTRDRCRFLRHILLSENCPALSARAHEIVLADKPGPHLTGCFMDREGFMLNSLSQLVNHPASGYEPLPDWTASPSGWNSWGTDHEPDDALRDPAISSATTAARTGTLNDFYSETKKASDSESLSESGSDRSRRRRSDSDSDSGSRSRSRSASSERSSRSYSSDQSSDRSRDRRKKRSSRRRRSSSSSARSRSSYSDSDRSSAYSRSRSPRRRSSSPSPPRRRSPSPARESSVLIATVGAGGGTGALIDLGDDMAGFEEIPGANGVDAAAGDSPSKVVAVVVPKVELPVRTILHYANGGGLNIDACFSRVASMHSETMHTVRLTMKNMTDSPLADIRVADVTVESGMELQPFVEISNLEPHAPTSVNIYIDFNQKTSDVKFSIAHSRGKFPVKLAAPPGELLRPLQMSVEKFDAAVGKLKGMQESSNAFPVTDEETLCEILIERVLLVANVALISNDQGVFRFCGETVTGNIPLFLTVTVTSSKATCRCNSDATVLTMRIAEQVKKTLEK